MIASPALRLFRNSEFIRYQKNVVKLCNKFNAPTLKITNQVTALSAAITQLDELFVVQRSHLTTGKLVNLDNRRDRAVVGLRMMAEGYTMHYNTVMAEAGQVLLAGIDKYGTRISRYNYMAETQVLESLADDCTRDAAMSAAVNTLGLTEWVAEMSDANTEFDDNYIDRTADYGDRPETNLGILRVNATEQYNTLVLHITAHATLDPQEGYIKIINSLNSLTEQYTKLINSRSTGENTDIDNGSTDIENDPALSGDIK